MACALPLQDITGSRIPSFSSSLKTSDGTLSFLANQEEHALVSSPRGPRPFLHPPANPAFPLHTSFAQKHS